jgi:hypothetical protein
MRAQLLIQRFEHGLLGNRTNGRGQFPRDGGAPPPGAESDRGLQGDGEQYSGNEPADE